MSQNYYFLGTILPDLHIEEKPEIGFKELENLLYENLSDSDYAKTITIRKFYDIFNLLKFLKEEPLDPYGNLDVKAMEDALITGSVLPPYVFEYLERYENKENQVLHFPALLATFFNEEIKKASGTFKNYLVMERELRLILVAFRSKKLGKDLLRELQYEDPEDNFVAQILSQKDAVDYEPPENYADLKLIFDKFYNDPISLEKALYDYRFRKIDELVGDHFFSINRVLSYMIKLIIIEKWLKLDKQAGLNIVTSMLKEPS